MNEKGGARRWRVSAILALLVLAFLALAVAAKPAAAAVISEPETMAEVDDLQVAKITRTVTDDYEQGELAGTATRRHTASVLAESSVGVNLWRYFHRVRFDYWGTPNIEGPLGNGRLSSPIRHKAWGEIYTYGWDFCCNITNWSERGDGDWTAIRGKQRKFRLCGAFCVQTMTPWIKHKIRGDGWVKWWVGGA